jgi:D-glycero-D-manno-heptose 1,7-bisphosphate phosphatase
LYVAVVTNQSVVGRGLISEEDLRHIHEKMMTELAKEHARVHHIFFAPDHPDRPTLRRKPGPQMLLEAMNHYHVPARDTVMVGDTLTDLMAAKAAGCRSILVRTGKGARTVKEGIPPDMAPVFIAKHLADAAPRIVEMLA